MISGVKGVRGSPTPLIQKVTVNSAVCVAAASKARMGAGSKAHVASKTSWRPAQSSTMSTISTTWPRNPDVLKAGEKNRNSRILYGLRSLNDVRTVFQNA